MAFNMPFNMPFNRYLLHLRPLARHRPRANAAVHPWLAELRRRLRHGAVHGVPRRLQLLCRGRLGDDGTLGPVPQDGELGRGLLGK